MKEFGVGVTLDYAWGFTKKHFLPMVGMLLLLILAYYAFEYLFMAVFGMASFTAGLEAIRTNPKDSVEVLTNLLITAAPAICAYTVCMSAVSTVLYNAYVNLALRLADGTKTGVDFSCFKLPLMTYVKVFFASLLTSVMVCIGLSLCILPGIFVGVRLMFVCIALIDDPELSFFDAFQKSWQMTKGYFWSLLLLGIMIVLIVIAGLCCCCVGVLVSVVIEVFAYAVAYVILSGKPLADHSCCTQCESQEA